MDSDDVETDNEGERKVCSAFVFDIRHKENATTTLIVETLGQ